MHQPQTLFVIFKFTLFQASQMPYFDFSICYFITRVKLVFILTLSLVYDIYHVEVRR